MGSLQTKLLVSSKDFAVIGFAGGFSEGLQWGMVIGFLPLD